VLGVVASLLGVNRYLTANGLNLGALLGFALVMGFGGAIISLLISKPMAKWSAKVQIIDGSGSADEAWIVETVRKFADKAGIGMPEVGIFEGDPNAFATGAFKNSALVAVSTGLLQGMTRDEVEAVIGHEVAHIANGDMVTMTLIQGVMNTFVVFLSRVIGYAVDSFLRKNDENSSGPGIGYMVTTIVLDIVLGFAAAIIVAWFSRQREFRADHGVFAACEPAGHQAHAGVLGALRQHGPGVLQQGTRLHRLQRQAQAAALGAGQVEQVVDHAHEVPSAVQDAADPGPEVGRQVGRLLQQLGKAEHAVEWRAQFVAHVGQQFGLGAVGALGQVARAAQRLGVLGAGHVGVGDHHAQRLPRRVALDHHAAHLHPLPVAALAAEPVLAHVARRAARQMLVEKAAAPGVVVRVQAADEGLRQGQKLLGGEAIELREARREGLGAFGDVPFPHAVARAVQGLAPTALAVAQQGLLAHAGGHVLDRAFVVVHATGRVAHHMRVLADPDALAGTPAHHFGDEAHHVAVAFEPVQELVAPAGLHVPRRATGVEVGQSTP
jgi:heat shock protein HtpX